ncbi:NAD(P)/FAD-dependent oxidoreductase [Lentilactobacillus sp. Marseille-Q4993]|uniref:dihydrolipoyl dehydrogenase family protein n=1 Tax=Lentilactobacillus sp. Marseille-Q4993 TaxID=3039492 RepID=UPI0024BCE74A|nr:NAD(P)/FAD-dependent oxidoreductase [Lentilactobacillus sp. Marseille-Q4993]
MNYDVIFIGSGHASWHAAVTLSQSGKKVAIVEEDTIAGTCTNYGCDAKILLDGPFEMKDQLSQYPDIIEGDVSINWPNLMNYKRQIINPLPDILENLFVNVGIDVIRGHGKLVDAHTVKVNQDNYTTENIVVATGEDSRRLDIPGSEYMNNSRDFLNISEMPKRITFVGAGIISLEFASMAIQLGSEVTVVEFGDRALANFYDEYVDKAVAKLEKLGVKFIFNASVTEVDKIDNDLTVKLNSGESFAADYVLDATGRTPNVDGIGLEDLGIEFSNRGIKVDDHLRTNVPSVYASGDVLDKPQGKLTPTATFESNYIATQILGDPAAIDYSVVPSVVFTLPRISQVGVTVAEAKQDETKYAVAKVEYGKQMLFQQKNELDAEFTVIVDRESKLIVGATIYGNEAADLINFFTLIINQKLTANQINQMIFAFPSTTSGIVSLLTSTLLMMK